MKFWLIKVGEIIPFTPDSSKMRTAMLADALVNRGHEVLWWTSAFDHFNKKWHFDKDTDFELYNGVKVKALKGFGYKKNISFSRWLDARLIARKFRNLAFSESRPDAILASTPAYDLAFEAAIYAQKMKIPIVIDIRDQWPDVFFDHIPLILKPIARFVLSGDFKILKEVFRLAYSITAISEELLSWGLKKCAERERSELDRVFYLGYQKSLDPLGVDEIPQWLKGIKDKFIVIYQGTFNYYHDPSILIECAKEFLNGEVAFVLAGKGELWEKIKKAADKVTNVILPGWLNQKELAALLYFARVGVCPTPQKSFFLPNKAFAYFSAGLPIIFAFEGELKEICEKYQVGFYYPPGDAAELARQIKFLLDNPEVHSKMSENAFNLFNQKFDADKVYQDFALFLEELARRGKSGSNQEVSSS